MFVVKRDGRKEDVKFDKITSRINKLCYGLDSRFVDSIKISQKVRDTRGGERRAQSSCRMCVSTQHSTVGMLRKYVSAGKYGFSFDRIVQCFVERINMAAPMLRVICC